jgi:hypothetical protein
LKKPTGSVQFRFYKPETKKTKPNPNRKKTGKKQAKPEKNRAKLEKIEPKPSQTSLNRFFSGFGFFFKKKFGLVIFF